MVSCVLFVGFLLVVVVPFKVGLRKAATCFNELLFLCVRDVEVSTFMLDLTKDRKGSFVHSQEDH